jgi:Arc/MetJ-type ribon-helix-helix transcriptional regulator
VQSGSFASMDDAVAQAVSLLLQQREQWQAAPVPPTASQKPSAKVRKPIWEIIEEENRSIPPEVWEDLPSDLSAQHDHYIYGTPKRTDA